MARNGSHHPPRPRIEVRQSAASPEEAAAIAAAVEQFLWDTAPAPSDPEPAIRPWALAGLYEAAGLDPREVGPWS